MHRTIEIDTGTEFPTQPTTLTRVTEQLPTTKGSKYRILWYYYGEHYTVIEDTLCSKHLFFRRPVAINNHLMLSQTQARMMVIP